MRQPERRMPLAWKRIRWKRRSPASLPDHTDRKRRIPGHLAFDRVLGLVLGLVAALGGAGLSLPVGALPNALTKDWYQVELLIFVRDSALADVDEQWEPLPELTYPATQRFLVRPELADRRRNDAAALVSTIDERGIQTLAVSGVAALIDVTRRPDALINEPFVGPEAGADAGDSDYEVPPLLAAPPVSDTEDLAEAQPGDAPSDAEPERELDTVSLVRPETVLPLDRLEFRAQARTLRRRGQRVLFHETWWSRLREDDEAIELAVDRGADPDVDTWPELQGSVRLYRSRYLHIEVDVWLNTLATYFPEGWRIEAPPLPRPSVVPRTLSGVDINPWAPVTPLPEVGRYGTRRPEDATAAAIPMGVEPSGAPGRYQPRADSEDTGAAGLIGAASDAELASEKAKVYPWHHAIRHVQSRRMRSAEIHYLDHPVIGVIVRIMPAVAGRLPLADDTGLEFLERHSIPVETLELPLDWATES